MNGWCLTLLIVLLGVMLSCKEHMHRELESSSLYLSVSMNAETVIQLNSDCPPGFQKNENNECVSKNMYLQYKTNEDRGVGGLKTPLPVGRDGFSPQQIDLGRYLFFDPILSVDGSMSCATCHDPSKGFSDGRATAIGLHGEELPRSTPSLWNVSYFKRFFWDGRVESLEKQLEGPLFSKHEMGNTPDQLHKSLNQNEVYKNLFAKAFPDRDSKDSISLNEIYLAITAFESSLISLNSKYDRYAHGFSEALNENEIEGLNVFRSFVARCAECHTPPLFTNQQIAVIGSPEPEGKPLDVGAEIPFKDKTLRAGFKVPSLRNVAKTAPYMHSGRFKSLKETIQFYTKGRGHAVPEGEDLYLHWHIWEPNLTEYEMDRLVDFLNTLSDETFLPEVPKILPSEVYNVPINREL